MAEWGGAGPRFVIRSGLRTDGGVTSGTGNLAAPRLLSAVVMWDGWDANYTLLSFVTTATRMAWSKEPMTQSPSLSGLQSKQQMG